MTRQVTYNRPPPAIARQSGVALLVTILMVTLALILLVGVTYRHELDTARTSRALISEQAILLALSAESWAKDVLSQDAQDNATDSFDDTWAQAIPVFPVENGFMTGCMIDMQSYFNLNNLGYVSAQAYEAVEESDVVNPVATYLALREIQGLSSAPQYAATLIDWMDTDSNLISIDSAEDDEYSFEEPARLAANAALTSVIEIASVYGYSTADIFALDNVVTTLPAQTPVNVNTAAPQVLDALSPLLDEFGAESLVEGRPYNDLSEVHDALETLVGFVPRADIQRMFPADQISVESTYFELRAQVSLGGENIELISSFQRPSRGDIRTLSRRFQYIPDLVLDEDEGDENPFESPCLNQSANTIEAGQS